MPRVLLLLPTTSWRAEALLAACSRLSLEVTVGTDRPLVWAERLPERVMALDFEHPDRAAGTVAEFARVHPLAAVVGADDETAGLAAVIAARLGLPHNPIASLAAVRDKLAQRERLAAASVPVPAFTLVRLDEDPASAARRIEFPCVVKPRRLSGSRGVMRADDWGALARALRRLHALLASADSGPCGEWAETAIVETFVPGREVALEGVIEDGALRVLALFDKPDPLDGPCFEETIYVTPSRLAAGAQAAIAECAGRATRALGLVRGPVHAELRVNEQGPWLIELAARPIGGLCSRALRFEGGVTLEELILMQALGMETRGLVRERESAGVMMLPIPGDGVLERVEGEAEAGRVPLIEQVVIIAHPGERMVPFPEGSRYPGFLFARGPDPGAVESALREAGRRLHFVLAPPPAPAGVERATAMPAAGVHER